MLIAMSVTYDKLFCLIEKQKITSNALMLQANISGNIISQLQRNEYLSLETIESICRVFQCRIDDISENHFIPTAEIQNRRYLGNKFKLLDFIVEIVNENCSDTEIFADIFAGTGSFASAFIGKTIITNDLLYSNHICNMAWFGNETVRLQLLKRLIFEYNRNMDFEKNYMTENFSNTYFSNTDCSKIGVVREDIEQKYLTGIINDRERAILITSLIYGMDKIANTCGHYDAWRRGAIFKRQLILPMLNVPEKNNENNRCFNEDANELVLHIEADLIYIDPPYNSRQYSDTYHLLENVASWQKPTVYGVARKMNRENLKSDYCTSRATTAFEDLIKHCQSRYILFSYNNMANKGDARSNARIADEDILRILNDKGDVKVFSKKYKPFNAGKSNISENEERLFLCTVRK